MGEKESERLRREADERGREGFSGQAVSLLEQAKEAEVCEEREQVKKWACGPKLEERMGT